MHFNNSTKIQHSDCIVTDSDEQNMYFGSGFSSCELKCVDICEGRKEKKSFCKVTNKNLIKKYLNNTHILYLSIPFPDDDELKPTHCKTIHQLEGAILAAAIEYFKMENKLVNADGYVYVLNTTGKAFNYHDSIKNNYLAEIRKAINDCLVIFPDLTQSP